MRGHDLGRVLWEGEAAPDTGIPGSVGGAAEDRVVRAPAGGSVRWEVEIGEMVSAGQRLGEAGNAEVVASIEGVVRGLISPGFPADRGLKIADIDPRGDPASVSRISDKARLVGGGVLEAVMIRLGAETS